jgi:polar amino acid transport system substrate-binding protein
MAGNAAMTRLMRLAALVLTAVLTAVLPPNLVATAQAAERIVVDSANPPFMYAINGRPAGVYPAMIAEAMKRLTLDVDLMAVPWRRALEDLDKGQVGVAGIYKTAARLTQYDYSDKLFDEVLEVYVRRGDDFRFTGIDSLKGRLVGVILGWSYGDAFDAARAAKLFRAENVTGDAQNFSKLVSGRIDTVIAIREAGAAVIASADLHDKITVLEPPLLSNPSFLAFNKTAGKTALLRRFNDVLTDMHRDGSFDLLIRAALGN